MPHRHEMLAHDVQAGMRHQMVDIGHPTRNGILDRNHAEPGFAGSDCGKRVLESRAGHRLVIRKHLASSEMGVRSRLALKDDFLAGAIGVPVRSCSPSKRYLPSQLANQLAKSTRQVNVRGAGASKLSRTRSRSSGVSTPSGTLSTMLTSMRIPASSARSCSSFSRCSSGEGGSATKRASASRR